MHPDYAGECHCQRCDMAKEIAQLRADKAELVAALQKLLERDNGNQDVMHYHGTEGAKQKARNLIAKHSKI